MMQSEMYEDVHQTTSTATRLFPDSDIFMTFQDKHFYTATYVLNVYSTEMGSLLIY